MSWVRPLLSFWLRLTEKPYLARETDPGKLRARLDGRARRLFPPPPGTRITEARLPSQSGDLPVLWTEPETAPPDAPVLLYFHGGGYVFGSPHSHAHMAARLAGLAGMRACLPFYRLAPENPFPAALEDATAAWRALTDQGIASSRILLAGDSAGGGLALALLAEICRGGGPKPAGLVAFSPLTDLTFSGESYRRNASAEALLPATRDRDLVAMYLRDADPAHPGASPLFAGFKEAPPVLLTVSDTEILLDDSRRMAAKLTAQGVDAHLRIARRLPHVWPFFWRYLPEGQATLRETAAWIRQHLPRSSDS